MWALCSNQCQTDHKHSPWSGKLLRRRSGVVTLRRGHGSVFPILMQAVCPATAIRHGSLLRWIEPTATGKKLPSSDGPSNRLSPSFTVPDRTVPPTTVPTSAIVYTSSIYSHNGTRKTVQESLPKSVSFKKHLM